MDWFDQLEKSRSSTLLAVVTLAILILAVSALRDPLALDSWWHLKMGQDLIERGLSPFQDHYSITHYGEEIYGPPVFFQVALYSVVRFLGESEGFKFFVFANSLIVLGFALQWLRQIRAPVIVSAISVLLVVAVLQSRAMVRPELFSYFLIILALILYEKTRTAPVAKNFLFIALLMLFWRNFHAAFLGYVIFSGLFLDLAYVSIKERQPLFEWIRWLGWGVVILAVGFLGQDYTHPIINALSFSREWVEFIDEYRPALSGKVQVLTLFLIPISAVTLIGLIRQRLIGYFFVCLVMSWYAFTIIRMTTPGGLVIVCLFALSLVQHDPRTLVTSENPLRRRVASATLFGLLAISLIISILTARSLVSANRQMLGHFPDELVAHMKRNGMHGNIFNEYKIGGYLIYHLGDSSRVFMDGRTKILYTFDHAVRWKEAMTSPDKLRDVIEKEQIDYVITGNRRFFIDVVRDTGMMQLEFADLRYSLYAKENASLPVTGAFWSMPWCWSEVAGKAILAEKDHATGILPSYSPAAQIAQLASAYYESEDRMAFLETAHNDDLNAWYEDNLRFAGYRALAQDRPDLAENFFHQIRDKVFRDFMAGALANLGAGNIDEAEKILYSASQIHWTLSNPVDAEILYRLLLAVQSERPFKWVEPDYMNAVAGLVPNDVVTENDSEISVALFCN
jgi:hypothetical protein